MHGIAYIYKRFGGYRHFALKKFGRYRHFALKKFGGYRHFALKKFGGRRNYWHLCVKYTKDYRRENGINYLPVYMTMLL